MPRLTLMPWILLTALLGASAAHAFDRLNVLVSHVPVPAVQGLRYVRFEGDLPLPCALLGEALLFGDGPHHRILCLREGRVSVFAGNGDEGDRIDPDAPCGTALGWPDALLVLPDQSVLVSHRALPDTPEGDIIVRIRTRPREGEPTVSMFAGNGQPRGAVDPASALRTPLCSVEAMALAPDGSVLVCDAFGNRVLRIRPEGGVGVVAGTGAPGPHLEPASGAATQLNLPFGLAVLADGSVLIADCCNDRVLRVRNDQVTVYAGAVPAAEHPVALHYPTSLTVLPDGSVALLSWPELGVAPRSNRVLHVAAQGVSLLGGDDEPDGLPLDPGHYPGLRLMQDLISTSLVALGDGSLVIGSSYRGIRLLSPPDALQTRLEARVAQGKAAVAAGDLAGYRRAVLALAYLCAPGSRSLRAVSRGAHDLGRLEPPDLRPGLHLVAGLVKQVAAYAEGTVPERLRAQLALRELRTFKKERLGR